MTFLSFRYQLGVANWGYRSAKLAKCKAGALSVTTTNVAGKLRGLCENNCVIFHSDFTQVDVHKFWTCF